MALDTLLLSILADPVDKGPLLWSAGCNRLVNPRTRRAYVAPDGYPLLLAEQAVAVTEEEVTRLTDRTAVEDTIATGSAGARSAVREVEPVAALAGPGTGSCPHVRREGGGAPSLYDGNAEWYDRVMRDPGVRGGLHESAFELLRALLGPGEGVALDIGCGTGIAASLLRDLGYQPLGLDFSADQLRIAVNRLPVAQADAQRLPIAEGTVPLALSTFAFGDWADLAGSAAELHRALRHGGRFVDITVHPCFNGGFARAQQDGSILQRPGYHSAGFLEPSHFGSTIRGRVGAWHRPLDTIVNSFLGAGFQLSRILEGGPGELPSILALSFVKP
jgi:SAM-dependent methyltransferase/uncharacterized protein YbaR (Trm112 family)